MVNWTTRSNPDRPGRCHCRRARLVVAGFSLVELALVMAIVAVLAGIALPRYGRATSRYRVRAAAQRVEHDVALARATARATGSSQSISFSVAENAYVVSGTRDLNTASNTYRVSLAAEPYMARIDAARATGAAAVALAIGAPVVVTFDGFGVPSSGAEIELRAGSEVRTVVIDEHSGKARSQ